MNTKPLCPCGHTATQHANVKHKNKAGQNKIYTACRICDCKAYKNTTLAHVQDAPETTITPQKPIEKEPVKEERAETKMPVIEAMKDYVPTSNGWRPYIERKIEDKTDFEILETLYRDKKPLLIIGDSGVGKTAFVHHFAYKKGLPLMRHNLNGGSKVDDFVGQWTPTKEGGFKWEDGVLTTFVRNGGVFVVDEINSASAEMLFFLHSLLDDDRKIVLVQKDGEVIKAHKDFFFISTMNPDYEGTKPLNQALQDRFVIMKFDYDTKIEKQLIKNHKLLVFADKIRKLYRAGEITTSLSTRALIDYEKFLPSLGEGIAEDICIFNKYKSEEIKPIKEVFDMEMNKKERVEPMNDKVKQ
jgi:nitric oxide reductase NorQ protein